jgi:ABC-type transport system involved in multi-copper enzyme maturation permease subunit
MLLYPATQQDAVTENNKNKFDTRIGRRRMLLEAWILFLFAWVAAIAVYVLRSPVGPDSKDPGILRFAQSTLGTGFEFFVFGYLLSRFFKQFKTGCAFAIILLFAYLLWSGRH